MTNRFTEGSAESTRVVGPDRTVDDGQIIEIGNEMFRIYHPRAAHSDSDILIEVVSQNAIIAGDIIRNQFLGTMGEESSFEESIATLDFILSKDYEY